MKRSKKDNLLEVLNLLAKGLKLILALDRIKRFPIQLQPLRIDLQQEIGFLHQHGPVTILWSLFRRVNAQFSIERTKPFLQLLIKQLKILN